MTNTFSKTIKNNLLYQSHQKNITDSVEDSFEVSGGKALELELDWDEDGNFRKPTAEERKNINIAVDENGVITNVEFKGKEIRNIFIRFKN